MTTKSILGRLLTSNGNAAYRHGPTKGNGEARLEKTGSVRKVNPPTETKNDACPIHVIVTADGSGLRTASQSVLHTGKRRASSALLGSFACCVFDAHMNRAKSSNFLLPNSSLSTQGLQNPFAPLWCWVSLSSSSSSVARRVCSARCSAIFFRQGGRQRPQGFLLKCCVWVWVCVCVCVCACS